jgi:enterochelin esterase-like enzyme
MSAYALTAVLLALSFATALAGQPGQLGPDVGADRRVTFRLLAPAAREVFLTGEFAPGQTPLQKGDDGVWRATIGPLDPEIYHYTLTIDGVRTIDPGNPSVKTGTTASTLASILEIRGESPAFYDGQPVPHGDIRGHWYASRALGTLRRLTVYTPPGYDGNLRAHHPVLYLLHGANADEQAWHRLGRVNHILDNLLAAGRAKPFIVVMPFGYGVPPGAPAGQSQNTARFAQDLVDDVLPFIQTRYRVSTDRSHRAIVGLSMGGGQALTIGLARLELFSHIGAFSAGLGAVPDFPARYPNVPNRGSAINSQLRLLWIGCGTEDGAFAASRSFSTFLTDHRVKHTFHESAGAHTWMVWRRYLHEVAPLLFR